MHFAMPPKRRDSRPPPYAARNNPSFVPPALRNVLRGKPRVIVGAVLGFLTLLWLLGIIGGGSSSVPLANIPKVAIGSGAPVVIVTVLDSGANPAWVQKIKANREEYAKKHGMPPSTTVWNQTCTDRRRLSNPLPHTLPISP